MLILNLAAGKLKPILEDKESGPHLLVNLDTSYYSYMDPEMIEDTITLWNQNGSKIDMELYCNEDAFTFMERTRAVFDRICLYRFLEHVPFEKVPYFIYLLSTITKKRDLVDVIVPNYHTLAEMLYQEDVKEPGFEKRNILLTTELLNEPSCPHASIWTIDRAQYFMELEGRFKITVAEPNYEFDGRDIYLRFIAKRV